MLIPTLVLVTAALGAGVAAVLASFAQYAILSAIAERESEPAPGEDYADLALLTRVMENPRGAYLQLSAVRNLFRWTAVAAAGALGAPLGVGWAVAAALGAALVLFALEEELPLRLVVRDPIAWGLRLLPPLSVGLTALRAMAPLFDLVYRGCRALVRRGHRSEPPLSVEELTMMAAAGGADLGAEERRILRGIFRSSGILVADIMTPRDRVQALPAGATVAEALEMFRGQRHSRLPAYDGSLDHVVGVAHAKDFLDSAFAADSRGRPIRDHLRDAYFVRQDRRIHALFEELREGKIHLAIVVDRMGRTTGIVSLDDILEEIVGEIHDELEAGKLR